MVKSSIESESENTVTLNVEIDIDEFDSDLEKAFEVIAAEVKLPGFRKGKAPRKVLEARVGQGYARQEAFRRALPHYYSLAVVEHELDVIAPPDFNVTGGEVDGPVSFTATVQTRPEITVSGYDNLSIEIEPIAVNEEELTEVIDSIRKQTSSLSTVDRPAIEGDKVSIDISTTHDGEDVPGYTTKAYSYEVGSGTVVPELDEHLVGASSGDELDFKAEHPDPEQSEPLAMSIIVNEVSEVVLPELTDEWAAENSEFDTVETLKSGYMARLTQNKLINASTSVRDGLADQLAELVQDDVPQALIDSHADTRLQEIAMRLEAQGISFDDYLTITGTDQANLIESVKNSAEVSARVDLALRSIAKAENIRVSESDLEAEYAQIANQTGQSVDDIRTQLIEAHQQKAFEVDVLKSNAMDWVTEKAEIKDTNGKQIAPTDLEIEDQE